MIINNVGFNHSHDVDFFVERPKGSGDYLFLLIKTGAFFNLNGIEKSVSENSFILYKKGGPQIYRCIPKQTFTNDWIHFDFESEEEKEMLYLHTSLHCHAGGWLQSGSTERAADEVRGFSGNGSCPGILRCRKIR